MNPNRILTLELDRFFADDGDMLAPSVRQSYAELILRGFKTIEYRSGVTEVVGEERSKRDRWPGSWSG